MVRSTPAPCETDDMCRARFEELSKTLDEGHADMRARGQRLDALAKLRVGIFTGKRFDLPSAQREHLERGSTLINEVSFHERHRPWSTNVSHFVLSRTLVPGLRIRFSSFMPLKRSTKSGALAGPSALFVAVDDEGRLSICNLEGVGLLQRFDLGHGPGRVVTHLELSPSQENHFVVTGDDAGIVRVHNLKVIFKREKKPADGGHSINMTNAPNVTNARKEIAKGSSGEVLQDNVGARSGAGSEERVGRREPDSSGRAGWKASSKHASPKKFPQHLIVTANFSSGFRLPRGRSGERRILNALLPMDRGTQAFFLTGDSLGAISIFHRNGTVKARARVTDDPGGVKGLLRSQGQNVMYYSSHEFGFFSVPQVKVQHMPCVGWNSPLVDIVTDPVGQHGRVVLALADGDVLVFSTTFGKAKVCDLIFKFPRVSMLPLNLHLLKGHVFALQTANADKANASGEEPMREIFFFNMGAMEAGYGVAPSGAVMLQASFKPKQPEAYALHTSHSGNIGERARTQMALRFVGYPGVDLFDLDIKQPPAPAPSHGPGDDSSWFEWIPKAGVFGVALVGVGFWSASKAAAGHNDADDDFLSRFQSRGGQL